MELPGRTSLTQALGFAPDPAGGGPITRLGTDLLWQLQPLGPHGEAAEPPSSNSGGG